MAIAKQSVGVTRGYKPNRARGAKRSPGIWLRAAVALRQNAREMLDFARDEIVYATMDTMQLLDYIRYMLRRETRARVAPVMQELETFVHEHESVNETGLFAVEQVSLINVRSFKR